MEKSVWEAQIVISGTLVSTPEKPPFKESVKFVKASDPNGIRTRVTPVKGECPNHWTIGSFLGKRARKDGGRAGVWQGIS